MVNADRTRHLLVPREYVSKQVRRLGSGPVLIRPWFEGGREAVCLTYGRGFLHWSIVIGPLGSVTDPNTMRFGSWWIRWGDGIYDWQQG